MNSEIKSSVSTTNSSYAGHVRGVVKIPGLSHTSSLVRDNAGHVWVTRYKQKDLVRVDPNRGHGQVIQEVKIPKGLTPNDIGMVGDGNLLVLARSAGNAGNATFFLVDAKQGSIVKTIATGMGLGAFAHCRGNVVWVAGADTLSTFNLETGTFGRSHDLGAQFDGLVGGATAWVTTRKHRHVLRVRVDGEPTKIALPSGSGYVTAPVLGVDGHLWVAGFPGGDFHRIDPGNHHVIKSFRNGSTIRTAAVASTGDLWYSSNSTLRRYNKDGKRIGALDAGRSVNRMSAGQHGEIWAIAGKADELVRICPIHHDAGACHGVEGMAGATK